MSNINKAAVLKFYVDIQEYSDRLTAIEAQAASSIATHKTEVAAAIAQVNLTQSQTITALTLEVNNLKTSLTSSITATQTELINKADQLRTELTGITQQLTQDKAAFTQEIQDALDYLKDDASVASALRTPRKINGTDFDGRSDITTTAWGTARTLTLGSTGKSINGSADVSWSADEILPAGVSGQILKHNGTSWVAGTDNNILYSAMTAAEATSGTATTASLITPAVLKSAITFHAPVQTTSTGNAESATKLQTARLINGIAFDGTGDINLDVYSKAETDSIAGTPNATETVAGKAKIATTAISKEGTNDTDIITALKLKQTLEDSKRVLAGSVNFNGTGTVSIRSQLNVSSITDFGVGKYRINMTTSMPNTKYPVFTSVANRSNGAANIGLEVKEQTASSITVCTFVTGTGAATDVDFISVGWTL